MSNIIMLAIIATSIATYLSRILGAISSEKIKEDSKIFKWFNCLAYSTLAALISRILIFPEGALANSDYLVRFSVIIISVLIFFISKKNLVYPTVFSAIILSVLNSYF